MKFGKVPAAAAEGAIVAHTVKVGDRAIRKGTMVDAAILADLAAAGIDELFVARPEDGDIFENEAASAIAARLAGGHVHVGEAANGRVDLTAEAAGVLLVDRATIEAVNLAQTSVQVATLAEHAEARAGQIIATIKVVPFAVDAGTMRAAMDAAHPSISLARFQALNVGVIVTEADHIKPSVTAKTLRVLGARLAPARANIGSEISVPHDIAAVAKALTQLRYERHDFIVLFGASATSDAADIVPAAIEAAGGTIERVGMPVDPGNLLVLGSLKGKPVIGAPGCARSPAPSGFDWVLQRLLAGLPIGSSELARMGVGGVLAETRSRRFFAGEAASPRHEIAAVVLAAGRSSRMNGHHKLLAEIDGRPMVRLAVEAAAASVAGAVIVVVGHGRDDVARALDGLDVTIVDNPDYASGLSSSLKVGIESVPDSADAAIVLLADMPDVDAKTIDTLVGAFDPELGRHVVVPTSRGKAGNPVLWARRFFPELTAIEGDMGARELIRAHPEAIAWVEVGPAVTHDVDTPEAMAAIGGRLSDDSQRSV